MYPVKPGVFRVGDFFYSLVRPHYIGACGIHMMYISYSRAVPA